MAGSSGTHVTARDIEMLSWIGRHGMVTADQVAQHFFARAGGTVGTRAAYRRLRKLEEERLVRRDVTFARWPAVIRVTGPGARVAEIDVDPARLVWAEVRHSLALVDLTEELLATNPGATLVTEREIRALRFRGAGGEDQAPGLRADPRRDPPPRRRPDGCGRDRPHRQASARRRAHPARLQAGALRQGLVVCPARARAATCGHHEEEPGRRSRRHPPLGPPARRRRQ